MFVCVYVVFYTGVYFDIKDVMCECVCMIIISP